LPEAPGVLRAHCRKAGIQKGYGLTVRETFSARGYAPSPAPTAAARRPRHDPPFYLRGAGPRNLSTHAFRV
jgi:hypothetical protein